MSLRFSITTRRSAMLTPIVFIGSLLCLTQGSVLGLGLKKMCLCRCGVVRNRVYPYQFPWLAIVNSGSDIAGGSLISDQHVLTVASPFFGVPYTKISVTLGIYDRCGDDYSLNNSVTSLIINPGFSPMTLAGNLALVKLRHPVTFNEFISPVCLPYLGWQDYGRVAWTSAWRLDSVDSSCIPRVGISPIFPGSSCISSVNNDLLTPDKGCLDPLGTRNAICEVDLGAPVLWRWSYNFPFRLMGVVSSSPSCPIFEPNSTTLYTKVIDYLPWIHDSIRSDCNCF